MEKIYRKFQYEKDGSLFIIETERYGAYGFDIFVTAEDYGAKRILSFIPLDKEVIMLENFKYQGRRFGIRPPVNIMNSILSAKSEDTEESKAEKERKRKEREWDNLYNEGADGFNPYRRWLYTNKEPYYKGDETPE